VKALAAQTARATEEVSRQIAEVQTATREAVVAIQAIGESVGRASEVAGAIAAAVEEQGATTQEIARAAAEAAQGAVTVTERMQVLSDASEGAVGAVREVNGASAEVARQSETLRAAVGDLSARLRRQAA
jgi:methyl-accepting chemotaxis protein